MDKFKDISTDELIDELKGRGYFTDLLWCREDVDRQLEDLNEGLEEDGHPTITLEDGEKDEVLENAINTSVYCEHINVDIYEELNRTYVLDKS